MSIWVFPLEELSPNLNEIVADKLSGVMATPPCQIANVGSDIIDAVRDYGSIRKALEIMAISLRQSLARDRTLTLEVSNHLLLLGVNTEYWDVISFALRTKILDFLEQSVSILDILQSLILDKETILEAPCLLLLVDDVSGHLDSAFLEQVNDLKYRYSQPNDSIILWQSCCMRGNNLVKNIEVLRVLLEYRSPATSNCSDASFGKETIGNCV